ncbi:DUF1292 domain-containing protein [uncultured Clostridium sp.]|jgi:uncharacterized protein YrzB (UPF0473 family)|uniref:DUF1292 domain-containing protein n=1 Tax=uncultured Clostridium sp. TaxID=59620 RepID=UPI002609B2FA|nr:DUF1292 domain-containing protein [uncultured Clostridium sp.]
MENELNKIVLSDENGVEVTFEIVTKLEIEDSEFFLLSPEEDDDVIIAMRVIEDEDGNTGLEPIENDVELAMIEEAYATIMSEEE